MAAGIIWRHRAARAGDTRIGCLLWAVPRQGRRLILQTLTQRMDFWPWQLSPRPQIRSRWQITGGHLAGRPPCDRAASLWDIPPQVALAHQTLWPDFFHGPDDPGMPIPAPPCYLPFTADLPVEPAPYQQTGSPRVLSVLSHRLRDSDDFWW